MRSASGVRRAATMAPAGVSVALRFGDLAATAAGALVTSSNDSLVGNTQPTYWRFISRVNADSAVRKLGGPDLERACLAIEPLKKEDAQTLRRDITRWTSGVKHGSSAVVRCPAGSAVATSGGFGKLKSDHVIHAVSPDSEFGYEGMYTGGLLDQTMSGAVAGSDTPNEFAGGAKDGIASQQFTPPDDLLLSTYESAIWEARQLRVSSVAICSLGTGVKGWKPAISAALGLEAVARLEVERGVSELRHIEFVIGGASTMADECWRKWAETFRVLLGPPTGLETPADFAAEAKRGELRWQLEPGMLAPARSSANSHASASLGLHGGLTRGTLLELEKLDEFREMWQWRRLGKNGKDEPLTPEQELQAVGRRSTR